MKTFYHKLVFAEAFLALVALHPGLAYSHAEISLNHSSDPIAGVDRSYTVMSEIKQQSLSGETYGRLRLAEAPIQIRKTKSSS